MVPVVVSFKLQDLVPAGVGSGDSDGLHGRFGSGVGEAHHVSGRDHCQDFLCYLYLKLGGGSKHGSALDLLLYCLDYCWVGVAQNEGSIAGKQVNVFVIVDVLDSAAMSIVEEDGEGIVCVDSDIGGGSAGQESFRFFV